MKNPPAKHIYLKNFQGFLHSDYSSSSLLVLATLVAIFMANGLFSEPYLQVLQHNLTLQLGPLSITETVRAWINATLMAVFFLTVGLEIKQEVALGSLSSFRQASLPVAGAIGGMAVPAAIFLLWNWNQSGVHGWAIPMATDPAFVIAILSVLRHRVPTGVRTFLIALAVVDDIGATVVIALVYNEGVHLAPLLISLIIVLLLALINKAGVKNLATYLLLGVFLWMAFLKSGIHTSIAAVILAFMVPVRSTGPILDAPLNRLERCLAPWVNYLILPVFALSNAGISFQETSLAGAFQSSIAPGVFFGLVIGKPLGIMVVSFLAVWLKVSRLPIGVHWQHMASASVLCGIGFTTSIFLASLAFEGGTQFAQSKIGILSASLVAALVGGVSILRATLAKNEVQFD